MASVFLSYDRDDAATARQLARAIEKSGHKVWWDRHIKSGTQFSKEIEAALARADAVVVLWSEQSVESAWVRDEAAAGRDRGRLVPVAIGDVEPPLGFRQYQTTDLSKWNGRTSSADFKELLDAIGSFGPEPPAETPARRPVLALLRPYTTLLIGAAFAIALIAGLLAWRPWSGGSSTPIVAVAAASQSAEGKAMARDLLAKLGNLHSTQTEALKLIQGGENAGKTDLVFEVDGAIRAPLVTANLVLLAGKDRALLWSKDFEEPLPKRADLEQQLAFTAARVLECALEGLSPRPAKLSQNVLKLYLNACASFGTSFMTQQGDTIPRLERVTQQAPRFEPGWAKLLLAATDRYIGMTSSEKKIEASAQRRRIVAARKINPALPEAYIAEVELLQEPALFYRQLKLLDLAAQSDPENAYVLNHRSLVHTGVGRMEDAVNDARRAADLDPLSPANRNAYIGALIYSGKFDTAKAELAKAERLWPGASTILDAKMRLLSSYGNPTEALNLYRSGEVRPSRTGQAFLEARLNRSPENIDRAVKLASAEYRNDPTKIGRFARTLAEFERIDELYNLLIAYSDRPHMPYFVEILFRPEFAGFRAEPRFMRVAAHFGVLDYWRQSGRWPDFCSDPDLPYVCRAEAAKLVGTKKGGV